MHLRGPPAPAWNIPMSSSSADNVGARELGSLAAVGNLKGRGGPGGWWILYESELHLGDDILVPDIAGWRRERMPEVPDVAYFSLAPGWVYEVLSPSTRKLDLHGKRPIYAREGVEHLWLVDPTDRTLSCSSPGVRVRHERAGGPSRAGGGVRGHFGCGAFAGGGSTPSGKTNDNFR